MNDNKIMRQISAVFSVFMVFFYVGIGCFFVFYFNSNLVDKPVRVIMGSTFFFYGFYRAFKAYVDIKNVFFTKDEDND
jgi:hypothetical protein